MYRFILLANKTHPLTLHLPLFPHPKTYRYYGGVYDDYGQCVYPGQANYNTVVVAQRPVVAVGGVAYRGGVGYRGNYRYNWGGGRPGRPITGGPSRPGGGGRGPGGRGGGRGGGGGGRRG